MFLLPRRFLVREAEHIRPYMLMQLCRSLTNINLDVSGTRKATVPTSVRDMHC